eukprot:TRINITY_DN45978_c0_g1_i1.p1 TRINITY_DN45978_c0_g1~~TRINITY_DN45978_c0_g1_i1.p1  ORF type:complete len:338 (-),score=39.59 TRINITY_DN45978_c0_g1_i1:256-1239(-)
MGNQVIWCCSRSKGGDLWGGVRPARIEGSNHVELAATLLFSIPALGSAYHTSVLVNGEEFFFCDSGIVTNSVLRSHDGNPTERISLGYSQRNGQLTHHVLAPHFQPGSYDLLTKNCNSFSDCALWFLLERRLDSRYSRLERLGQTNPAMVQKFTKGAYEPKEAATNFKLEDVIRDLDELCAVDFKKVATPLASVPFDFCAGTPVTIFGLKNATHLNEQRAQIVRYNAVNGRWEVMLMNTNMVKSIRAENLRATEPELEEAHASEEDASVQDFEVGSRVRLQGLSDEGAEALTGREGVVTRYNPHLGTYTVDVDGQYATVDACNLQAV